MTPPFKPRKSPRLAGYDYAQAGAYFVTICTHNRDCLFGNVMNGEMILNVAGQIAWQRWFALPDHHNHIELDYFVVMPNHIHGIIYIVGTGPALSLTSAPDNAGVVPTLSTVIGSYKSGVTRRIREARQIPQLRIWQGRYHDHIIRNETDLNRIREYVVNNPARWQEDTFFV